MHPWVPTSGVVMSFPLACLGFAATLQILLLLGLSSKLLQVCGDRETPHPLTQALCRAWWMWFRCQIMLHPQGPCSNCSPSFLYLLASHCGSLSKLLPLHKLPFFYLGLVLYCLSTLNHYISVHILVSWNNIPWFCLSPIHSLFFYNLSSPHLLWL